MLYNKIQKRFFSCITVVLLLMTSINVLAMDTEGQKDAGVATELTDRECVEADKRALNIGFTECVSRDLVLPEKGENGSIITWKSSKPKIISNDGKYNKPKLVTKLTLTATLQKGDYKAVKEFKITANSRSFYDVVKDYIDIMLEKGRDDLGRIDTGMFLSLLERDSMIYPQYEVKTVPQKSAFMNERTDGVGMKTDIYLYELCYDLARLTGDSDYEEAADKALNYFITYTQNDTTGFFGWGDHIVYDPVADKVTMAGHSTTNPRYQSSLVFYHEVDYGVIHFLRSPFLMQKFFDINSEATKKYLLSIWRWQVADQDKYTFSRHSTWDGGSIIEGDFVCSARDHMLAYAWGYHYTGDPEFVDAMMANMRWFETWSSKNKYDVIPSTTLFDTNRFHDGWTATQYAVGTTYTMCKNLIPEQLQERMQLYIDRTDNMRMRDGYDENKGFPIQTALRNGIVSSWGGFRYDDYERWCQLEDGEMKTEIGEWILNWIENNEMYDLHELLGGELLPNELTPKIKMYLAAYDISKDEKYLHRALETADLAIYAFWDIESLLPRQSYFNGQYYETTWGSPELAQEIFKLYYLNEEYKTGVNQYKDVWASSGAAPKSMLDQRFSESLRKTGFFKEEVSE